ncbi:hypothetical protein D9M72_475200 [compost metagenome]
MIPDLYISKLESSLYKASLTDGGIALSEPTMHATIVDAPRFVGGDLPDDFAHFVNVHDDGVSSGTIGTMRLAAEAEAVASQLVDLVAAVHRSEANLAHKRELARDERA